MDVVLDALNGFRGKVNSTKMKVNGEDEYLRGGTRGARDANFTVHYPSQFFFYQFFIRERADQRARFFIRSSSSPRVFCNFSRKQSYLIRK
jgi:hypothetical protein